MDNKYCISRINNCYSKNTITEKLSRKTKNIVVLGGGESGVGAALLAKKLGFAVFVSDYGVIKDKYKQVLLHYEILWEEKKHSQNRILKADEVVKSPGIPDNTPIVKMLKEKQIPVISEIEFAARETQATIIAITGSNGKTTTATLTYEVLKLGGLNVALTGNIGDSFAGQVSKKKTNFYVLEVSSFQLDGCESFAPHIAVLTNLSPDHLDRYNDDFSKYIDAKFKIVQNQNPNDFFIYDADDEEINKWLAENPIKSQLIPFSISKKLKQGTYIEHNNIIINIQNKTQIMPLTTLNLEGKHNLKNAMAAGTVAKLLNIRKETIRQCLENFHGVEHRLEKVLKINNVTYINDSKATNVNATYYALESMTTPVIWIVGGEDKGNDYACLFPLVNEKVKAIICLGIDNQKIINSFGNIVDVMVETQSMNDAVKIAYQLAKKGDTVLLSPACASFDLFENYEDRGKQFKEAVRNL